MRRAGHLSDVVVLGLCLSNMVSLEVRATRVVRGRCSGCSHTMVDFPEIYASVVTHILENIKI